MNPLKAYMAVAKAEGLTPAVRCVAMMLVDFAANDEEGLAWPSQETLRQRAGCRRETANKAVAYLVKHGAGRLRFEIVERRTPKGGGRPYNVYRLTLDDPSETHIVPDDPSETHIDSSRSRIDSSETHTIKPMNKPKIKSTTNPPMGPGEGRWGSGSSFGPPSSWQPSAEVVGLAAAKNIDLAATIVDTEQWAEQQGDPIRNWDKVLASKLEKARAEPKPNYPPPPTHGQKLDELYADVARGLSVEDTPEWRASLRSTAPFGPYYVTTADRPDGVWLDELRRKIAQEAALTHGPAALAALKGAPEPERIIQLDARQLGRALAKSKVRTVTGPDPDVDMTTFDLDELMGPSKSLPR